MRTDDLPGATANTARYTIETAHRLLDDGEAMLSHDRTNKSIQRARTRLRNAARVAGVAVETRLAGGVVVGTDPHHGKTRDERYEDDLMDRSLGDWRQLEPMGESLEGRLENVVSWFAESFAEARKQTSEERELYAHLYWATADALRYVKAEETRRHDEYVTSLTRGTDDE